MYGEQQFTDELERLKTTLKPEGLDANLDKCPFDVLCSSLHFSSTIILHIDQSLRFFLSDTLSLLSKRMNPELLNS